MLSVRVGFRVLNPIKKDFVVEFFFNSFDVPGFRNKYNYTKTINIHVLPSIYVNTSQDRHVDVTCTYGY